MNSSKSRVWWRMVPWGVMQSAFRALALCGMNWNTAWKEPLSEPVVYSFRHNVVNYNDWAYVTFVTAPPCCHCKQLHIITPVLLVPCSGATQQQISEQLHIPPPHSDRNRTACPSNLQAATADIDLAKFTELNKRWTPHVVNGTEIRHNAFVLCFTANQC